MFFGEETHIFQCKWEGNTNKYASLLDHHISHRTRRWDYASVWSNMPLSSLFIVLFFFFCLVCCLICLCKENYSVPAVSPLILSDTGQFTAQTERVCWRRLRKKCLNLNKKRLMCNKFSTTTREIKHLYLAWKGVIGGKISLTGSMTHCSPQGNQCC